MKIRGEHPNEIAGQNRSTGKCSAIPAPGLSVRRHRRSGGDGSNSINISTASAFVAAAWAESGETRQPQCLSKSGSSDLAGGGRHQSGHQRQRSREALEITRHVTSLRQQYHAGFRHAMPVRQQLKTRTLFNVLGPLINPAHPAGANRRL
ncbi:hypothetical protein ACNKHS_07470 [Shigella flexneri]